MSRLRTTLRATPGTAAAILGLVAASAFALQPVLVKLAYATGLGPVSLLAWRFPLAAAILLVLAGGALRRVPARKALAVVGLGAVLYATQSAFFFLALQRLDAPVASLAMFTYPALVAAGAVLLGRERASRRRALALGLGLLGVSLVLVGPGGGSIDALGTVFALGASLGYATYVLLGDRLLRDLEPRALAALVVSGAALSFLSYGAVSGELVVPDARGATLIGAIVLVGTVLPLVAFLGAVRRIGPSRATIFGTAEPPLTILLAALVFGDRLGLVQVAGAVLVVAGIAVLQVRRRRPVPAVTGPATPEPA